MSRLLIFLSLAYFKASYIFYSSTTDSKVASHRKGSGLTPAEGVNAEGEGMSGSTPEAAASPVAPDGLLEKREPEANCCEPADDAIEQLMLGCKYSSLRRAQRLSFAVGAVLDGVSGSEGRQVLPPP